MLTCKPDSRKIVNELCIPSDYSDDSGIRTREPPLNMPAAMSVTTFFRVFPGKIPEPLYRLPPYPVDYVPYTGARVVGQLQLLMFFAPGFSLLVFSGYNSPGMRSIHPDVGLPTKAIRETNSLGFFPAFGYINVNSVYLSRTP